MPCRAEPNPNHDPTTLQNADPQNTPTAIIMPTDETKPTLSHTPTNPQAESYPTQHHSSETPNTNQTRICRFAKHTNATNTPYNPCVNKRCSNRAYTNRGRPNISVCACATTYRGASIKEKNEKKKNQQRLQNYWPDRTAPIKPRPTQIG